MDRQLFNKKLEPIGYLKRRWGGAVEEGHWEELTLKLFPKDHACPPCTEAEFIWKRGTWNRKCTVCGKKTQVSSVFTK